MTNRQTYDLLGWLGDVGGLVDALVIIGQLMAAPFSYFFMQSRMARTLVKTRYHDGNRSAVNERFQSTFMDKSNKEGKLSQANYVADDLRQVKSFKF